MAKVVSKLFKLRMDYQLKTNRKLTLREVSEKTGITEAALSRLEQNKTERIEFDTLNKLCEFYGVGVSDVLERVEDEEDQKTPRQLAA